MTLWNNEFENAVFARIESQERYANTPSHLTELQNDILQAEIHAMQHARSSREVEIIEVDPLTGKEIKLDGLAIDRRFVQSEIQRQLRVVGIDMSWLRIKVALREISEVFEAAEARGEEVWVQHPDSYYETLENVA